MKRRCEDIAAKAFEYVDGEMTRFRRIKIWWHLRRCPPCADGVGFERTLKQRIGEDCREQVPEELLGRLSALIRDNDPKPTD